MNASKSLSASVLTASVALAIMFLAGCKSQPVPPDQPGLADAERLKDSTQYEEALDVVHRYLSEQPNSAYRTDALVLAGECEVELKQYDEAQRDFQDAQMKPRNSAISARAKFGMGQAAFAREKFNDAITAYDAALKTNKGAISASKALQKIAFAHIRNGNWTEGRKFLAQVTKQYPGTPEAEIAAEALAGPDSFQLRCGSFETSVAADRQAMLVKAKGQSPSVVPITRQSKTLQTVVTGKYSSFADAKAACTDLGSQGVACFIFP
jgi:TolA-binding protein